MAIPVRYDALIFDFDGVVIDSEYQGNLHLADYLTSIGHPTTVEEVMANFMGLAAREFLDALENWLGHPVPEDFYPIREAENQRMLANGIGEIAGAAAFIRSLPADLPIAIASSSNSVWLNTHLDHLGLKSRFEGRIFSGREHVERGKPAPDIYLYAAAQLGVDIKNCAILEDSPVGVTGALAAGADVIGVCIGDHCGPDHGDRLRQIGVQKIAHNYAQVAEFIA